MKVNGKILRIVSVVCSMLVIVLTQYCVILFIYIGGLESTIQYLSKVEGMYYARSTHDLVRYRKLLEDSYQNAIRRANEASIIDKIASPGLSHNIQCAKIALEAFDKAVKCQPNEVQEIENCD